MEATIQEKNIDLNTPDKIGFFKYLFKARHHIPALFIGMIFGNILYIDATLLKSGVSVFLIGGLFLYMLFLSFKYQGERVAKFMIFVFLVTLMQIVMTLSAALTLSVVQKLYASIYDAPQTKAVQMKNFHI